VGSSFEEDRLRRIWGFLFWVLGGGKKGKKREVFTSSSYAVGSLVWLPMFGKRNSRVPGARVVTNWLHA
jgi:hypothetical protein